MDGDIVLRLLELAEPGTSFEDVGGRRILRDAADEILAARACAEMMLQGTGQKICESMAMRVLYRQWIPATERLPDLVNSKDARYVIKERYSDPVLVFDGSEVHVGTYGDVEGWLSGYETLSSVTHWMPFPAGPTDAK